MQKWHDKVDIFGGGPFMAPIHLGAHFSVMTLNHPGVWI